MVTSISLVLEISKNGTTLVKRLQIYTTMEFFENLQCDKTQERDNNSEIILVLKAQSRCTIVKWSSYQSRNAKTFFKQKTR